MWAQTHQSVEVTHWIAAAAAVGAITTATWSWAATTTRWWRRGSFFLEAISSAGRRAWQRGSKGLFAKPRRSYGWGCVQLGSLGSWSALDSDMDLPTGEEDSAVSWTITTIPANAITPTVSGRRSTGTLVISFFFSFFFLFLVFFILEEKSAKIWCCSHEVTSYIHDDFHSIYLVMLVVNVMLFFISILRVGVGGI